MIQLLKHVPNLFRFSKPLLRTQIFESMTDKELATPQFVKKKLEARIPNHSRVSLISLYHGKRVRHAIKSCFSQKKTKKFKKVNKIKRYMYSDILQKKIFITMSNKAYRCIKKAGSFDKYILITSPKRLDSKIGQYYRTLLLRKINNPNYRLPYIIGTGRKERRHQHKRYQLQQQRNKIVIPKDFRKNLLTYQKKFGTSIDQFNEQDYQKYLQAQKLKKLWGRDVDNEHPLLKQIQSKMNMQFTKQEIAFMQQKSQQFKQQYLNHPKNTQLRRQSYEYSQKQAIKDHLRIKQAFIKKQLEQQNL